MTTSTRPSLPAAVTIRDVGPRDGLQPEAPVPVADRIRLVEALQHAGLRQIEAKTVDFGASDAPLKDDELAKKGLVQFPTVIGGIVPVVNIKGMQPGQLKLSGQVLGDIYLGKITKWNDEAIKALTPGLNLPDATKLGRAHV